VNENQLAQNRIQWCALVNTPSGSIKGEGGRLQENWRMDGYDNSNRWYIRNTSIITLVSECSKNSFIRHAWGIECADRSILPLERMVTYDAQF
jgi:hypothetical protein